MSDFPQQSVSPRAHVDGDPHYGRCGWTYLGQRCRYPGACSHGTLGRGPWYCIDHLMCSDPDKGAETVRESRNYSASFDPRSERRLFRPAAAEVLVQEEPGSGG